MVFLSKILPNFLSFHFSKAIELENKKTMVSLDFMCEGRKKRVYGFGTNKIMAKRAAAKIALRSLKV
jgi:hypothetical protein